MTDCYTDNAIPVHVTAEQGQLSLVRQSQQPTFPTIMEKCLSMHPQMPGILRAYRRCADGLKEKAQLTAEVQAEAFHTLTY